MTGLVAATPVDVCVWSVKVKVTSVNNISVGGELFSNNNKKTNTPSEHFFVDFHLFVLLSVHPVSSDKVKSTNMEIPRLIVKVFDAQCAFCLHTLRDVKVHTLRWEIYKTFINRRTITVAVSAYKTYKNVPLSFISTQ